MTATIAIHMDYAPPRRQARKGHAPLTPERKARILRWARTERPTVIEDSMIASIQSGNTARAELIAPILAERRAVWAAKRAQWAANRLAREPKPRTLRLCAAWVPIAEAVAAQHGVAVKDMLSGRRVVRFREARTEFWWVLWQRGIAYAEIGRRTGGYDHTSVRHGVMKWAERVGAGE